eukprot:1162113-Pelagomonas_calceolata.AAC.11
MAEPPHTQPLPPPSPTAAEGSLPGPTAWPRHWPRSSRGTMALILELNQPHDSSSWRAATCIAALGLLDEEAAAAAQG